MHSQSSRHIANTMDAVECMIAIDDLEFENDVPKRDDDRKNKSRRDQRAYENTSSRTARRSPPSVTRKPASSPISSSASRSRNHHPASQKYRRNSSPSPPPPPPPPPPPSSSSRHHPSTRPIPSTKRAYSPSDSSRERRQPTHRSRTDLPSDKSTDHISTSNSTIQPTKITSKPDKADLSLISEDESSKKSDIRNSTAITQSSPLPTNNGLYPVASLSESFLDTSILPPECELSLFAKSTLSNSNTSSLAPSSTNNFNQTLDVISKYKTIATSRGVSNTQIDIWLKEIPAIIQKQIDLQKTELDVREREIKLRERELAEREKRFREKSTENPTLISDNSEPIRAPMKEERTPVKSENTNHDIVNISPEESVVKTISSVPENSNSSPTAARKTGGKTRFSPVEITPPTSSPNDTPSVEVYSNELSSKKSIEPIVSPYSTELKVTSSSTSRKVEIGSSDSSTPKSSAQDLRLTLSKNRSKYSSNEDDQTIEISPNSDEKQSSADEYQSQRSITSTPIESDVRRHRQQYSSNSYNNQRSYNHGSSSKYGSNQKRGENPDLRSRLYEQNNSKPSRSTYKNTH